MLDLEHSEVKQYTENLKELYNTGKRYESENPWPPFTPSKFTDLGFVIHKPKRTQKETEDFAKSQWSGNFASTSKHACETFSYSANDSFDTNVIIKEKISDMFLPAKNDLQIILVEGAPGTGKTMLLKEIGYLWAIGDLLSDKDAVLLLPLRDPNFDKIQSLEGLFLYCCKLERNAKICASYFCNNSGSGLVILLDGLDENIDAINKGSFLFNLIRGRFFSRACIVITSRPHATIDLQMHVSYRVEIIGFTLQRRREFVHENLNPDDAADLEDYLKEHAVIDTLCYIPLNLSIFLFLFMEKIKRGDDFSLPTTQTELIKRAVEMTVSHNLKRLDPRAQENDLQCLSEPYQYIFRSFCRLAYKALAENKLKLTFTGREIQSACPIQDEWLINKDIYSAVSSGLGLVQTVQFYAGIQGDMERLSNFVHFSVQELLAAWDISFWHNYLFQVEKYFQYLPLQSHVRNCMYFVMQKKQLEAKFWKGEYINMWSLYIGLTKGKDKVLKHFLSGNWLIQCKEFSISQHILDNKINTLLLYMCLREAPGNEIAEQLSNIIGQNSLDLSKENLNEKDVNLLGYILSRPYLTSKWKHVNLSVCDIDDDKFEVLHNVLTRNDGIPKPEIQKLSLPGNNLKSCGAAVANVAQNQGIVFLYLSDNKLKNLSDFKLCTHLEILDLSRNSLTDKEALELFPGLKFLKKLKELILSHNIIGDAEHLVDTVGSSLCYCCNSLKKLELDGNTIQKKAMTMFEVINFVKIFESQKLVFNLPEKSYSFIKILYYCSKINSQPSDKYTLLDKITSIVVLDLSCSGLQDNDAEILGKSLRILKSLKTLDITKNNITNESTKELTKGILLLPKLKWFKYDKDSFNELSVIVFEMIFNLRNIPSRFFKCTLSHFDGFIFMLKCISELNDSYVQSSDIVETVACITELYLIYEGSGDMLADESVILLCPFLIKWFRRLEILCLNNNNISADVTKTLVFTMLQIHSFKRIKLDGNPIFDCELDAKIFSTILDLHEEELQSFNCDEHYDHQICESILFIMDCLNEIEHPLECTLLKSVDSLVIHSSKCISSCKFVNYINFLPGLQCLNLSGARMTEYGINELSAYLTSVHQLKELDLSFNDLENLQIHSQIVFKKQLTVAKFNNCNVTDKVLHDLVHSLIMFGDVEYFELEGNRITSKGINQFYSLLTAHNETLPTSITSLNLSSNQLDLDSVEYLIKIVDICNIKALNVSHNHLNRFFFYLEQSKITTLEELDISYNNRYDSNSQFLQNLSYLSECNALKMLNISNNSISEVAMDHIYCYFLKCFKKTNLAEMQCICYKNPASAKIEAALNLVKNLYNLGGHVDSLYLEHCPEAVRVFISIVANQYGEVGKEMAAAINYHASNIKIINFSDCNLQIDENFAFVLCKLTSLEELKLSKNRINSNSFIHLVIGYLYTKQLKLGNVCLEHNPCTRNKDNNSKLEMIDRIRAARNNFKCLPKDFDTFLFILGIILDYENCDVYGTISCIKCLDLSSLGSEDLPRSTSGKKQLKLHSEHVQKLCRFLTHFQSLEVINMRYNNVATDAEDCLMESLLRNNRIVEIDLEDNPIHIKGRIATRFKTLKDLRKCYSEFKFKDLPEVLQAFVELLQYISKFKIKSCDIVENIEHLYIREFYQQRKHKQLYSIGKAVKIVTDFINHLNLFQKLRTLDLSNAHLTANAIQELPGFLCSSNTLEKLDISENHIEAKGASWILQQLQDVEPTSKRPRLLIIMTHNDISCTGDEKVAELICSLPTIISVDVIKGNKFTEKAVKILRRRS